MISLGKSNKSLWQNLHFQVSSYCMKRKKQSFIQQTRAWISPFEASYSALRDFFKFSNYRDLLNQTSCNEKKSLLHSNVNARIQMIVSERFLTTFLRISSSEDT